jgi:alpha-glucosidase
VIREALFIRYSLIHYAYTTFKYGSLTGIPIMRPMMLEFPAEEEFFKIGNQFMYGDKFLVSPKIS